MATYLGHQEDSSGNILLPTPHSMATQIEFGTTASQAYAKGAYVVFNNRLCKASTAIASGDTLAIGTNLVQCSIGSELNSHLQAPNGNEFYFDYKDGKPGFYPSASKVASEFVPFGGSIQYLDGNFVGATKSTTVTLPSGSIVTGVCGSVWMSSGIGTHRFYAARTSSGIEQVALTSQNITAITVTVNDNTVKISYTSPFSASDSKITYRIAYI